MQDTFIMEYVGEVLDHKQFRSVLEPHLSLPCELWKEGSYVNVILIPTNHQLYQLTHSFGRINDISCKYPIN